jgi:UDP-N-acetylmuramate dehydrogenase
MLNAGTKTEYISQLLSSVKFLDQSGSWQEKESSSIPWGYRDSGLRNEAFFIAKASFVLHPSSSIEVRKTIQQYMQMRKLTQPWDLPSAGSVFKNPPGMFAGKLIEEASQKGFAIGGARISEKHANFIVNTGGATAQDVRFLMEHVQKVVMAKYNIMLEPEIELIGDFL